MLKELKWETWNVNKNWTHYFELKVFLCYSCGQRYIRFLFRHCVYSMACGIGRPRVGGQSLFHNGHRSERKSDGKPCGSCFCVFFLMFLVSSMDFRKWCIETAPGKVHDSVNTYATVYPILLILHVYKLIKPKSAKLKRAHAIHEWHPS